MGSGLTRVFLSCYPPDMRGLNSDRAPWQNVFLVFSFL